jgi:hypothetical protein
VIVNGTALFANGELTGALPGYRSSAARSTRGAV